MMLPRLKPSSINHGEEAVADVGFDGGGEFDGDDLAGEGFVEQGPETFANAGGIDDDVAGKPIFGEVFELPEDGEVVLPGPFKAVDDAVGWVVEGFDGGGVDLSDGEGGGVTRGVGEFGGGVGHDGFVLPGEVEEEGVHWRSCASVRDGRIGCSSR